jgi:hypothetical protein
MARPDLTTRNKDKTGTDRLQWPSASFPHGIQMIFKKYDYSEVVGSSKVGNLSPAAEGSSAEAGTTQWRTAAQRRRAQEKDSFVLELPIPKTLTDSTGVSISSFERSFIEEFLVSKGVGLAQGGDMMGELKKLGNAIAGTAGSIVGGGDGKAFTGIFNEENAKVFARVVGTLGTSVLGGLGLGDKSIGAAMGAVTNPLTTLHFGGVDLRSFTFDWQLYPSNAAEADSIRDIVKKVKAKILPRTQSLAPNDTNAQAVLSGSSGLSKAYLEYPSVVYINLLGVNEDHFPRFKPCMCSNISVNYAEGGALGIAEGGVPSGISIQMQFMELEIQTAEDYGATSAAGINFDLQPETTNDDAAGVGGGTPTNE